MNMYNLLLGGGDFLLGESTGYSLMLIFIVCSFVSVPAFVLELMPAACLVLSAVK